MSNFVIPKDIPDDKRFRSVFPRWFGLITYREFFWTLLLTAFTMAIIIISEPMSRDFPYCILIFDMIFIVISIPARIIIRNNRLKLFSNTIRKMILKMR